MGIYDNITAVHLLDENGGSTAYDSSSSEYNGDLVNTPTWVSGGLTFSRGSFQYIDVTTFAGISGTGPKSWAGRFKTSDSTNIITLFGWGNTVVNGSTLALSIEAGTIYVRCSGCNGSFGSSVCDGNIHTIAVIVPDSATMNQVEVWVDGTQRTGTFANGTTALNTNVSSGNYQIGKFWIASNFFDGTIYEAYVWEKALDAADRTLLFAGQYPWYTITPTESEDGKIFPSSFDEAGTVLASKFSGSAYGPNINSLQIQLYEAGTSNTIGDPIALTFESWDENTYGGNYVATALIPPVNSYWNYKVVALNSSDETVATSAQTSVAWTVGALVGLIGQSNMLNMVAVSSTPPSPHALTKMYYGEWTTVLGNGAIRLANLLQAALDMPVGLVVGAVNDTGLVYNAGSGTWQSGSDPYDNFASALGAVGGVHAILFHQGEADMKGLTSKANYKAELGDLVTGLSAANYAALGTDPYFGIAITGTFAHASATDASAQGIREAQMEYIAENEGTSLVFCSGSSLDMVRTDQAHWSEAYYEIMARRNAQSLLHKMGLVNTSGLGPIISRATIRESVVTVTLDLEDSTSITELDGSTDGGSLTGWEVSEDDFAHLLTISSTAFLNNKVVLTLSSTPTNPVKLRYLYGKTPTITNTVHGDDIPQEAAVGGSLFPAVLESVTQVNSSGGASKFFFLTPKAMG